MGVYLNVINHGIPPLKIHEVLATVVGNTVKMSASDLSGEVHKPIKV